MRHKPEPLAADATRQLFETHRQRIFGFCLSQLGNHHDAEDAVQTTFLYAFGCLERGVVPEAELAWLFKIALNVCRTRRRSLGRRRRVEAPTDFDACEYAFAAPERGDDQLLGLSGALAAMPVNQRNALLLREWQGLSYAEIAEQADDLAIGGGDAALPCSAHARLAVEPRSARRSPSC